MKIKPRFLPNFAISRIKGFQRFPKFFSRTAIIILIVSFLSGYHPVLSIPPYKKEAVLAKDQQNLTQKAEISASSFSQPVNLPHPGYLSTRFSTFHPGVDIAAGLGMPIHPITSGVVKQVGFDFFGLGNFVLVSHDHGFESKYAHLGKIYVKIGQPVTLDNILGEVGLTGHTSGPHTHLEITINGKYIDPQTILPQIPPMSQIAHLKK